MKYTLKNVRLSFPSLFQKAKFNGAETKYEATLLLDKEAHADIIKEIQKGIAEKIKTDLKGAKLGADKICLRDGEDAGYDGYEGCMSFKAANNKRPLVIDRDKTPLTEEDGKIYSGCYVNAIVELWSMNNEYGKRVCGNLLGVQFFRDGEPFAASGESAGVDDFDSFEDDNDPFQ